MKIKIFLFIMFLVQVGLKANTTNVSANPIYTLAPGEEFVFGKIGTFENGDLKYTLAIVRKRNENKTFYRMGYAPYHPNIVQGPGNLKPYNNPKEHQKYDYWLIFKGKKFGPYDEIYEMNFEEPDVDKWVSRDGKTISFCGQKGNKFMGVVHNNERSYFYSPGQSLTIDPAFNDDIFGTSYAKGDFRMYINGKQAHTELGKFKDIKHSANGDLLYMALNKNLQKMGLYVNHNKVSGNDESVYVGGIIDGTNLLYYKAKLNNGSYRVVIGKDKFDIEQGKEPGDFRFVKDYVVFNVYNNANKKHTFYEYNYKTGKVNKHGEYHIVDMGFSANKLAYALKDQTRENGKFVHTYYFLLEGGVLIEKYRAKSTLDKAFMRISPKGDIYIVKKENKVYSITKNGKPYPFNGKIYRWMSESFAPSTDKLIVMSEIKSDIHHSYNNDVRLDIGPESFEFKGMYDYGSLTVAENANAIYSRHAAPGEDNFQKMIFKNGKSVMEKTWKHLENVVINNNGSHFAVMACNYQQHWPTNNILGYHPTNLCMNQNWNLIVDGKVVDGKYGAPTHLKSQDKLVAIKQNGNRLEIVDLLAGQPVGVSQSVATNNNSNNTKAKGLIVAYDRLAGCGTFYRNGNFLKKHCGWSKNWHIIEVLNGSNNEDKVLFYDKNTGAGAIYKVDINGDMQLLTNYSDWSKNWYTIVSIGCVGNSVENNKILFYDKDTGAGAIFKVDKNGNMQLLMNHTGWRQNWSKITWEGSDACNGLIKFETADGYWEKYTCDDNGNISLHSKKQ